MTTSLFNDFDGVSSKEWKQKIQFELNGQEYNESLIYATLEGINIKPFYTKSDIDPKLDIPSPVGSWKNNVKIIADLVYVLMKPLELLFLVTLYLFDQKPENRIAKQYLSYADRMELKKIETTRQS